MYASLNQVFYWLWRHTWPGNLRCGGRLASALPLCFNAALLIVCTPFCSMSHPCLSCGACCASYRVSFYFGESDAVRGGTVPQALVEPVSPFLVAMRGTTSHPVRCVALDGKVGSAVACRIYEQRASTCRGVEPGDERCTTARARHGLPQLTVCMQPA